MPAHSVGWAPGAPREAPGRPPWQVAAVWRHSGVASCAAERVPPRPPQGRPDSLGWRPAALGGHAAPCPPCGVERYAAHAGRNRPCPKGHPLTKAQGGADRQAALLPVPSCHGVLTLPHALTALVVAHKRPLLPRRWRAPSPPLLQCGRQTLGGQCGGLHVLPTWAPPLGAQGHGPWLVPGGALAAEGPRGLPTPARCLLPVPAVSTVCRGKGLDALHAHPLPETWGYSEATASLAPPQGVRRFTAQLSAKAWLVYAQRSLAGPEPVRAALRRSLRPGRG